MEEDCNADDNNSHPFPPNQAGPSTSVTEAYPGTKALIRPKKSARLMTKLVNAIKVLGEEKGAPLGSIRNYLIANKLLSPNTADFKILSTVSDALKKGIVTLGAASDFNWLFRLARGARRRSSSSRQKKTCVRAKKRKSIRQKSRKTGRSKRKSRKTRCTKRK